VPDEKAFTLDVLASLSTRFAHRMGLSFKENDSASPPPLSYYKMGKALLHSSQVHRSPKCDTHGHFCLIFGNIATYTNSSTLISKIIVAKLNSCVKMVLWGI